MGAGGGGGLCIGEDESLLCLICISFLRTFRRRFAFIDAPRVRHFHEASALDQASGSLARHAHGHFLHGCNRA